MSRRECKDLIETYMEYTELLESPDNYHRWCAVSLIASVLRRKVWVDMGYFKIYPNMYIVLVGPPGRCRKTVAINTAVDLITNNATMEELKISADSITREALIKALKTSSVEAELDREPYRHSSLTIVSKELSVFLGQGNHDLLSLLTDLYDSPNRWTYKTKNMGTDDIHGVWLNLLGASTPTWLTSSVSMDAIGGGFTSRVLFIVEDNVRHKTAFPVLTEKQRKLRKLLTHDLEMIYMMIGGYTIDKAGVGFVTEWYKSDEGKVDDPRFWGYNERKQLHLLKLATICAASESDGLIITEKHIKRALGMIDDVEPKMMEAFGTAGRNPQSEDMYQLLDIVKKAKVIEKSQLRRTTMRDVSPQNFDILLTAMEEMELITREVKGTKVWIQTVPDFEAKLKSISGGIA